MPDEIFDHERVNMLLSRRAIGYHNYMLKHMPKAMFEKNKYNALKNLVYTKVDDLAARKVYMLQKAAVCYNENGMYEYIQQDVLEGYGVNLFRNSEAGVNCNGTFRPDDVSYCTNKHECDFTLLKNPNFPGEGRIGKAFSEMIKIDIKEGKDLSKTLYTLVLALDELNEIFKPIYVDDSIDVALLERILGQIHEQMRIKSLIKKKIFDNIEPSLKERITINNIDLQILSMHKENLTEKIVHNKKL